MSDAQLALPAIRLARTSEVDWFELCERALATMRDAQSANTRKAYSDAWRAWLVWCEQYGFSAELPADARVVVSWLEWQRLAGYSVATIELRLTALAWADQHRSAAAREERVSLTQHPLVREWRRGHRKQRTSGQRQARLPTWDEIVELVRACYRRRGARGPVRTAMRGARDRMGILLSYYGAMRRSELLGLDVRDVTVTPRGLEVVFRRSKTDQLGLGETRILYPQSSAEVCPVHAVMTFRKLYDVPSGPLLPALYGRHGIGAAMTSDAWARALQRRCDAAEIAPISPHSLRAAFVAHALMKQNQEGDVAFHARMKRRTTVDRYARRTKSWTNNPTSGLSGPVATPTESSPASSDTRPNGGAETK